MTGERRSKDTAAQARNVARVSSLRVLIVHDWITTWAGSERVVEQLLIMFPDADLVVGVLAEDLQSNVVTRRAKETWVRHFPFARSHHRWFLPLFPAAFATLDTRRYDLVISSAHAFAKSVRTAPGVPHLCYCHSPPRYIWDLQATYLQHAGLAGGVLAIAAPLLRSVDRASARHVDCFASNSRYIAERIFRCYGREAAVVYPPVSPKPVARRIGERDDSFLSFGRLVPYKNVHLAIAAANAMGVKLIVAGDGPERGRLEKLAGPTVDFLGQVSEAKAGELMEKCRAMVFCAEEDFGIAPVEANAHGMPVVAYGRGGARESMQQGLSAVFFDAPMVTSVASAMRETLDSHWDEEAIRLSATRFAPKRFRDEMAALVLKVLS